MISRPALVVLSLLLAHAQAPPPLIELIADDAESIGFETYTVAADGTRTLTGRSVIPVGSRFPLKLDGRIDLIEFSNRGRPPLSIAAADLALAESWHLNRTRGPADVFIWSATPRSARSPAAATVIAAETAACASAQSFRLGPSTTLGMRIAIPLIITEDVARCRWIFLGMPASSYEAALRNAHGSAGREQFRVVAGQPTEVTIAPPAVTLSGLVTLNGKPVADGRLEIRRVNQAWTIDLQPDGTYYVALDDEGDHILTLTRLLARFKPVEIILTGGANTFDWNIEDPSAESQLSIRVTGHDKLAETAIEIQANGKPLGGGVIASGSDTFDRTGLPFGQYRVAARQSTGSSGWYDVELSAAVPSASVTLPIAQASRSITLRYADGEPVANAGFGNTTARPEETVPGTYSLATIAPNTDLLIRAPIGAPICRVVPGTGDVGATVLPGRLVTLRFQDRRVTIDDIKIATENDCPMALQAFLKSPLKAGPQSVDVDVFNAPPDDVLIIHTRAGAYRAAVSPEGVVLIPASQ